MGLRRWLWSVLSRGEPPDLDPDEYIEVAVVPVQQAPMAVALLARHRLAARTVELSRYPGGPSLAASASVQVPRRDAEEAARIIADES